jgi:anti-sigma factor RsiW
MTTCAGRVADLQALHDGRLGGARRRRLDRHLAACAACRGERARLEAIGRLLREETAALPAPDLWAALRPGLARIDAEIESAPPSWISRLRESLRRRRWSTPIGVGALAAGAAAVALALWPVTPPPNVVRTLDAKGHPVIVIPSEDDVTIIWMMDDEMAAEDAGAPTAS